MEDFAAGIAPKPLACLMPWFGPFLSRDGRFRCGGARRRTPHPARSNMRKRRPRQRGFAAEPVGSLGVRQPGG